MKYTKQLWLTICLISLLSGCVRYYTRLYSVEEMNIKQIGGWNIGLDVWFAHYATLGRKLTPADTLYHVYLGFGWPIQAPTRDSLDTTFRIESGSVRFDTGQEKPLLLLDTVDRTVSHRGTGYQYFNFAPVSIPVEVKRIQVKFIVVVERRNQETKNVELLFKMQKVEKVEKGPWLPPTH